MMREAADEMDKKYASRGVNVYYVPDFYSKFQDDVQMYLYEHKLPIGGHGAMMETSKMLYPRAGAGRLRAADLQDGAVRSDGADARNSGRRRVMRAWRAKRRLPAAKPCPSRSVAVVVVAAAVRPTRTRRRA